MSFLLNLVYALLLFIASPWIAWRRWTQGRYRQGWSQKLLGQLPQRASRPNPSPCVWLHAVSVGELQVIRPIIDRLERERPDVDIVVTTSTDSGYELARTLYAKHTVTFAPLDFTWAIRSALNRVRPDLLVLAELELWPNWLRMTSDRQIPIAIINARLSERSLRGYRRVAWLIAPILARVALIGAQSNTYRSRFLQLGCRDEQVQVTGNIKFDGATPDREHPEVLRRRELLSLPLAGKGDNVEGSNLVVWLCGSTQDPEETLCINAMKSLLPRFPNLRMILVPRHAERFGEVAGLVESSGLPWVRRSQLQDRQAGTDWRICLADSIGELRWWWGLADIGFVGGSFGSRGGQNMIEPCAYGVATCFGPNTRNFADVVQLLRDSQGAIQLQTPTELEPWIASMIEQPDQRRILQSQAREIVLAQRGAVEKTWSLLQPLIGASARGVRF